MLSLAILLAFILTTPAAAQERVIVEASAPIARAVTVYRDPDRREGQEMDANYPRGFAMISETRRVRLPAGESTIRFTGVAEGMVAVSAIVTGLPGGTIEKNRNADLLSPAALVDGTLGNRVRITRTNPGTGEEVSENAIVRTRADGGLVLQTSTGYEAVRCSGLPERLSFNAVPDGLSSEPVFTIDTYESFGGTFTVTLSYLAWGFDWQANYVGTLLEGGDSDNVRLGLVSWLTVLNDNGQSFADAELMVVAGRLNVVSDFEGLANPPEGRALELTCYPFGSTAAGSPYPIYNDAIPPSPPMYRAMEGAIVVTGSRIQRQEFNSASPITTIDADSLAQEEDLGDLKLYRIPQRVNVAAQSLKQVAFLAKDSVEGRMLYVSDCFLWQRWDQFQPASVLLETVNDEEHGLGAALPTGSLALFERSDLGEFLIAQDTLRDYATGQDVDIELGNSNQVHTKCELVGSSDVSNGRWASMRATITNANPHPVTWRIRHGDAASWQQRGVETRIEDGQRITEFTIAANSEQVVEWQVSRP